jgi:hypothetical protein
MDVSLTEDLLVMHAGANTDHGTENPPHATAAVDQIAE